MAEYPELRTSRLRLRCWLPGDRDAFAAINADARVMRFLGGPLSRERSDTLADWIANGFETRGYGFWAVEAEGLAPFIGITGLNVVRLEMPFAPAVEVGWRFDPAFWGQGYATEAARAALGYGFEVLGLDEIVAFTSESNVRSRRVMERVGMVRDLAGDFEHPSVAHNSPLVRHVLYRIRPTDRLKSSQEGLRR